MLTALSVLRGRTLRDYFLIAFAAVFTVVCVNLGFWQLRRLAQRKALNAEIIARLKYPPVPVTSLPRDSAALHYRQVLLRGVYDYAHQVTLVDRSRNGSPGVNIITPVRVVGTDTAVLVNRGWVYSPDGATADLTRWRESDSVAAVAYARPLNVPFPGRPGLPDHLNAYRWLDIPTLRQAVPYPLYPFTVILEADSASHAGAPPRVPPPPLDEGPHRSYAIQWFAFAVIAIVGTAFYLMSGAGKEQTLPL